MAITTHTAEGAVATFSALMPAKIKKIEAAITPVQTGTGDPSPSNIRPITGFDKGILTRTGVNIWDEQWEVGSLNADGQNYNTTTQIRSENYIPCRPNTAYCFESPQTSNDVRIAYYKADKSFISLGAWQYDGAFTTPADSYFMRFYMAASYGTTYNNDISINYPSTDTAYHPYSGDTLEVEFPAQGVNQWDEQWELGMFDTSTGSNFSNSSQIRAKNNIPVAPSTDYCAVVGKGTMWAIFYDADGEVITEGLPTGSRAGNSIGFTNGKTFTTPPNCTSMRFYMTQTYGATYNNDIGINYPATSTSYEPYTNTVYGGSIEVEEDGSGTITVDRASTLLKTVTNISESSNGYFWYTTSGAIGISPIKSTNAGMMVDRLKLDSNTSDSSPENVITFYANGIIRWKEQGSLTLTEYRSYLAEHPIHLIYELATPKVYHFTAEQMSALRGTNNLWANTGDISVDWQLIAGDVDLFERRRAHLASAPHKLTANGAVASFKTNTVLPLSLSADITPWQEGTGDASPQNERPIHGWTGANVTRAGKNLYRYDENKIQTVTTSTSTIRACMRTGLFGGTYSFSASLVSESSVTTSYINIAKYKNGIATLLDTFITPTSITQRTFTFADDEEIILILSTDNTNAVTLNLPRYYIQIEKGSTVTAYEPYTGSQVSVEFSAFGKNKLDPTYSKWSLRQTTYAYINNVVPAGQLARMTFFDKDTSVDISDISIGWVYDNLAESTANSYKWVLNNGSMQGRTETNITTNGQTGLYCQNIFIYPYTQEAFNRLFARYNIMVEMGDTASPTFEPYVKVYGGHIDIAQDGSGVLVVTHKKLTFTGEVSEGWQRSSAWEKTQTAVFYANYIEDAAYTNYSDVYISACDRFRPKYRSWGYDYDLQCICFSGTYAKPPAPTIRVEKTIASTLDGFLQYLVNNPVTIVYELATPKTYNLTAQQIKSLKGTNNVWCDTGNTTVKYWKH